jgi:hypothetical protein
MMPIYGDRSGGAALVAIAMLLTAGCSESRPPLRIAEPMSPAEEQRWQELWKQGSGPPEAALEDAAARDR